MKKLTNKILKDLFVRIEKGSAFNIRENGKSVDRASSKNVSIVSKKDKSGIEIKVKKGTINESIVIPVVVTEEKFNDVVYNDFYIGDNSIVTIYAGCIIHNECIESSSHEGIHTFYLGKNSKVKYIEQHHGLGNVSNNKIINTNTIINFKENSFFIMETIQNRGVDKAYRNTEAVISKDSTLDVKEKLLTGNNEEVTSIFEVILEGKNSNCNIRSKAVARDESKQEFVSKIIGNNECVGHVECDAILMDNSSVSSTPTVIAKVKDATLTHEAAIGKIAKDEIIKLMTLGLTEKEAEDTIIKGFIN